MTKRKQSALNALRPEDACFFQTGTFSARYPGKHGLDLDHTWPGWTRREALIGAAAFTLALAAEGDGHTEERMESEKARARVEHLGQPCRARNILTGLALEDAGREWFVLANTNEVSNVELIFIDPAANKAEVYPAPTSSGAWALERLPGNRLAVGTYYNGMFLIFDIARRKWIKTVKFPGEEYIWTFAVGSDGRLYGGTYPGGKLGALDTETYACEDLGAPSKANDNLYLRFTSALPDGRIFCQFGYTKTETRIFDPRTKQFTMAPAHLQATAQGVAWNGYFLVGDKAYRMPDLAEATPLPYPAPDPNAGGWGVDTRLTRAETLILQQGLTFWRYRVGEKELTRAATLEGHIGGYVYGRGEKGDFYAVRGQDYYVLHPDGKNSELRPIPGEAAPRDTHFLRIDAQGRLWGGPTFGQTLFYLDTKTRKTINTRTISDSGGESYDVAIVDGICYAVAYAGGEIIRFDPKAKWDQVNHINPKTIARVGPDYIRPSAGVAVGEDGRLYSGWMAKYGEYGGLVAVTDPKTGDTEKFKDPLGPHGVNGLAIIGKNLLLLGTTTYGNGLGDQKGVSAKVGVFNLTTGKAEFTQEFPGSGGVGSIAYDPVSGLAAFLVSGRNLFLFDVAKQSLLGEGPALPDPVTGHNLVARDGKFLYARAETLYALDPKTRQSVALATLPAAIRKIAAGGPGNYIYVACGIDVYRVKV